ncbi:hypothetical protein [Streptomyces sp. NPDC001678]|uniref:hypothetical protein n=1 Tax=Streptomyces sp. NPDC001678 TaxID=3364599 RepID=UPI00369722C3
MLLSIRSGVFRPSLAIRLLTGTHLNRIEMRTLVTVLAILAILIPAAGILLRKTRSELPTWYFSLLGTVALALAASLAFTQLS